MAVIAIAGIVVPAVVAFVAPAFVEFVKKKMNERKESLADIHEVLEKGLEELLALQSEKNREVSKNKEQKDPSELYKLWNMRVLDIKKKVTPLDEEYKQVKEKKWRHRERRAHVKKEIKSALNEVIDLLGKCKDMNVLVDKLAERVKKEYDVPPIAEYPTLQKAFQNIQDLIQSRRLKCVALHGQKGVGKTTIMQHLNNHHFYDSSDNKEFGMVIFIKVGAAEQIDERTEYLHILQKIAERMRVDTKGKELEVAERIQEGLKSKRYLLILDGVRYAFTLDGIWEKLDISKHQNDSMVVIATHYPLASSSDKVKGIVKLEWLSSQEALKMFLDIVGNNLSQKIPNAQLICEKLCCCCPLLINPVAKSIKYKEATINWRKHLDEPTYWPEYGVDDLDDLFSILKNCYDLLGDESKKKCFLYAALYPANSKIYTDYFVECCIVQGFLGNVDPAAKYSRLRSQGINTILGHLVNIAFLEEGEQMRYVKMNDLYRQLALHISSTDPCPECKIYIDNEQQAFRSTSWGHARWVSMIDSKRDSLPANQNFEHLETLLLQESPRLVEIPTICFSTMGNLVVLNLNGTRIRRLQSLSGLTSLKAFYLNGCPDLEICPADIQPLQHLEIFDIRGTGVNFVPCLERLRCLRISYTASGSYNEISKLHNLEELIIEVEMQSLPRWGNDVKQNVKQRCRPCERKQS